MDKVLKFSSLFFKFAMSVEDAKKILGLQFGFTSDDLNEAWKKEIFNVHPDRGGTHEAARDANIARDILMEMLSNSYNENYNYKETPQDREPYREPYREPPKGPSLEILRKEEMDRVSNPNVTEEELTELANSQFGKISLIVAMHSRTPYETILKLASEGSRDIQLVILRTKKLTDELINALSKSKFAGVLSELLEKHSLPEESFLNMSKSKDMNVQKRLLRHPQVTSEALHNLSEAYQHKGVARKARQHPKYTG